MTSLAVVATRPESLATTCFFLTTTTNGHHPSATDGVGLAAVSAESNANGSPVTPSSITTVRPQPVVAKIAPRRQRLEPAAPSSGSTPELLRCKRRIHFGQLGTALPQTPPAAVARRNERERNRVRMVNLGFATLRQHVPNGAKNKKMSKVETLRSAVEYIKQLQQLLTENDPTAMAGSPSGSLPHGHGSPVIDENCYPGTLTLSGSPASESSEYMSQHNDPFGSFSFNFTSPPCSAASSPTPSLGSDASSPYDSLSQEDEDLFTRWLS